MTTKTDFTPEAWQAILAAPTAIGQLVITASFGVGDVIKEAKAAKEGDFFGMGGQQVSAKEAAVLVEIKTVLGL